MKDLLKEAIADAKAVRETALANAKIALEEAFAPRLQSMLSAKLSEEMEDEMPEDEEVEVEGMYNEGDEMPEDESDEMPEEDDDEDEMPEEDDDDEDVDLEEIIRELEGEGDEEMTNIDEMDELESSGIGNYEGDLFEMEDEMPEGEEMEDEEVDIKEIVRALREEDEMESDEEMMPEAEEVENSSEELEEAYNVIRFLKGKINEVNLLNAKLLYSNKLFRSYQLSEGQKMKVIENFDRAHSLREVKLVYSTLAEGFRFPGTKRIVKESFASKPVASTRPGKQVLFEGTELANRFRKLAGLIN